MKRVSNMQLQCDRDAVNYCCDAIRRGHRSCLTCGGPSVPVTRDDPSMHARYRYHDFVHAPIGAPTQCAFWEERSRLHW